MCGGRCRSVKHGVHRMDSTVVRMPPGEIAGCAMRRRLEPRRDPKRTHFLLIKCTYFKLLFTFLHESTFSLPNHYCKAVLAFLMAQSRITVSFLLPPWALCYSRHRHRHDTLTLSSPTSSTVSLWKQKSTEIVHKEKIPQTVLPASSLFLATRCPHLSWPTPYPLLLNSALTLSA